MKILSEGTKYDSYKRFVRTFIHDGFDAENTIFFAELYEKQFVVTKFLWFSVYFVGSGGLRFHASSDRSGCNRVILLLQLYYLCF